MEYIIAGIALVMAITAIWIVRSIDAAGGSSSPPDLPDTHPDRLVLQEEHNRALAARATNSGDAWADSAQLAECGDELDLLEIGWEYPVRFQKRDGTIRDYTRFVCVFCIPTKKGILYQGVNEEGRVVGFAHDQLRAVWAGAVVSPAEMIAARAAVKEANSPTRK